MKKEKYYKRQDGLYETIRTINGKRVAFRGKTCREVDRKLLEYTAEEEKGRKFPEVADEWQIQHEKSVRESTRRVYSFAVRRLKEAFPGYIKEIRPLDIKRYIVSFENQGRALTSVEIELSVCKMIFSHAVLQGDIDVSPAVEVRKSRGLPKKKRLALTEAQEQTVKDRKDARFGLFAYLLLYTGMRRGEALALTYADIDRKEGVIHVTKKLNYAYGNVPFLDDKLKSDNGKRDVPLLQPLAEALPRNRVGLLFPGKDGYMTESEIRNNWQAYCREIGFVEEKSNGAISYPITPHCFRHSFATICYEAGLDPRQTAQLLGDTPEVVQGVYIHLREGRRQTAGEKLTAYIEAQGQ